MKKPLHIPKSKQWQGLKVYCQSCNSDIGEKCRETGKAVQTCKNGGKHSFKVYVHVPGTKNTRRTKKLETRDLDEAITQAIAFSREVKNVEQKTKSITKNEIRSEVTKPILLIHALARYIGWLNNEGVIAFRVKDRSKNHIKDVERAFRLLVDCLKQEGYDLKQFEVNNIDEKMIGIVHAYLLNEKKFGNRSYNKHFSYYTSFLSWYCKEYNHSMRNWFETAPRKRINANPKSISEGEYISLLEQIAPENGTRKYDNEKKPTRNIFRYWLKDGIKLGLLTGRRREEIISLKWSDIIRNDDGSQFIKVEDYKVNRIQGRKDEAEKKYILIPITGELQKLLIELGRDENMNSDSFILAPKVIRNRVQSMSNDLSKGFSHYYEQLNTGKHLTFKALRKTYITQLSLFMGGNAKSITGHSDEAVINEHYKDKEALVKAAQRFGVFNCEADRKNELNSIRDQPKNNSKQKEVEK